MTKDQWEKLERGIWDAEIGLDCAMCLDGNEPEEIASQAEELLRTATRLRKRIVDLRKQSGKSREPTP